MSRKREDGAELPTWGKDRQQQRREAGASTVDPARALAERANAIETAREEAETVLANLPADTRPDDVPRLAAEILGVDRARPLVCLYVQQGLRKRKQPPPRS